MGDRGIVLNRDKKKQTLHKQAYLKERFDRAIFATDELMRAPVYRCDRETGVEYFQIKGAVMPLLTKDGKPKRKQ